MKNKSIRTFLLGIMALGALSATAAEYYRISSFPIDGATVRDSFLIVVEYAGNTYIWNGQDATGKNYVCLENYSSSHISGNYTANEVAIVHNQWHSYYKLFSVLCKGDGDREDKGGYYLGGEGGSNGITFSAGQRDAEITFVDDAIRIATKSGQGIFRFNITPNDPHGFKFYKNETNMLYPTLYVKGINPRYTTETSLNNRVAVEAQATKVCRNGQLLIIRDGKTYTPSGVRVSDDM